MKIKKIEQDKNVASAEKSEAQKEAAGIKVKTDIKAGPADIAVCG
ncbi:hypothetical protein [Sorangium sp. So ce388]